MDKDRSSALLARQLGADALLLLTDVPAVEQGWGTPEARPMSKVTAEELRTMQFAPGSMGPKVSAACWFAMTTGGMAGIGALEDAAAILRQEAGTIITMGSVREMV